MKTKFDKEFDKEVENITKMVGVTAVIGAMISLGTFALIVWAVISLVSWVTR